MTPYPSRNSRHQIRKKAKRVQTLLILLFINLFGNALITQASPDDANKPIQINADKFKLDKLQGTSTYSGNVVLKQGSLKIQADKIVMIAGRDNRFERVIATGRPAQYQQKTDSNNELTIAKGNHIVYYINRESLSITDNAEITQPGNATITGDSIQYDIREQTVTAGSNRSKTNRSRVEIIIEPKKRP